MSSLADEWRALVAGLPIAEEHIAPPILRSWRRCIALKLNASQPCVSMPLEPVRLNPVQTRLVELARSYIEDLWQFVAGSRCVVALLDAQAVLIELLGDEGLSTELLALGLGYGASWTEERIGTNAADLALREAQPAQTSGAEHFCLACHSLSVAAAPLFDVAGQTLGALCVVTPAADSHPHTLGMVLAATQALHNQLRTDLLLGEANDRLAELNATFEAMSEGLVFVGPQGTISHINTRAGHMLGVSVRAVAGCRLHEVIELPQALREALERHEDLSDEELVFPSTQGKQAALCNLRPVWDTGRRYVGALITLRLPETVRRLVHRVMGAQAQLTFSDIVGESPAMQLALRHARIAANINANVLIQGERGSGKKLFAHAIHNASGRASGPFVALNCADLPRGLLANELFGVGGSEAAGQGRPGKLELASGGTLLLEEIGALPMDLQTDLLRAVENQRVLRGGVPRLVPISVRVIVTSSGDLAHSLAEGRFRADLYHRLSGVTIAIPPLRARADDLLLLQDQLISTLCERLGKQVVLAPDALEAMRAYTWPDNVRELEVTLEQLLHTTEKSVLSAADLPWLTATSQQSPVGSTPRLQESHADAERVAILRAGREAGGHLGRTATLLRISRATLWRKMRHHGLSREDLIAGLFT